MFDELQEGETKVEIIFPEKYVKHNMRTMRKFSAAVAHYCKAAAILGEDETEFLIFGMTIMQVVTIEEAMKSFGIELTHDFGMQSNEKSWVYFYADVRGLRERMERGEVQ